jgi:hypothetical protein
MPTDFTMEFCHEHWDEDPFDKVSTDTYFHAMWQNSMPTDSITDSFNTEMKMSLDKVLKVQYYVVTWYGLQVQEHNTFINIKIMSHDKILINAQFSQTMWSYSPYHVA